MLYLCMIVSIRHEGLRPYYEKGNGTKLQKVHLVKIKLILTALDAVSTEDDIKALDKYIHILNGEYSGFWALSITGNYRIIFRFEDTDILDVDFLDYSLINFKNSKNGFITKRIGSFTSRRDT